MANEYFVKGKSIDELLFRHPNQIPIIMNRHKGSDISELRKKKYLVTKDITISQFIFFLRKLIKLKPGDALFIYTTNSTLLTGTTKVETAYDKYKSEDGVLYITYSAENAFG